LATHAPGPLKAWSPATIYNKLGGAACPGFATRNFAHDRETVCCGLPWGLSSRSVAYGRGHHSKIWKPGCLLKAVVVLAIWKWFIRESAKVLINREWGRAFAGVRQPERPSV